MKRIILSAIISLIYLSCYSEEIKSDTLITTRWETSYKGNISFSVKNVINTTYLFKSEKDEYQIICYGQPTIIQRGVYPTMKYEVKKSLKNGDKIEIKFIEIIPKNSNLLLIQDYV